MKPNKKPWPLATISGVRKRINTNPDFQRPAVWSTAQKQLLVDTIFRDYDIPKLYWRKTGSKPDTYDVVDGQQRLRAIWEFVDGSFHLPKDADPIDGEAVAGLTYTQLPDDLRQRFDVYPLDIVVIEDADEDEVRELFLRLQNGTTLKAQEKRNAYPGEMRSFVHALAEQPFFKSVAFSNSRFSHDHIAAQIICLELAGGPVNIKNADLNKMYRHRFDSKSTEAKAAVTTLDHLRDTFPEKTPELERYNVISLYCVVAELRRQYVFGEIERHLHDWFVQFEQRRREQEALPEDETDTEWAAYKEKISHSTDSADSIRGRMEFMLRGILEAHPALSLKDNRREFTHVQKLTVFRRDKGICQLCLRCEGTKVTWDDWHCDHRHPWSKGGPTTVENGVVSCTPCNLAKGSSALAKVE